MKNNPKILALVSAALAVFSLVSALNAGAQSPTGARPEFEVASIRLHQGAIAMVGLDISGRRIEVHACNVTEIIALAYSVKDYQLANLPDWTRSDRYDIVANSPGTAPSRDQARQMLQTLLADRFGLVLRPGTKEMPVYALVVAKNGPKFEENAVGSGLLRFNRKGRDVELAADGAPIASLVNQLPRMPGVDRPVLDKTGLTGKYDFRVTLTDFQLSMNAQPQSIPAADSDGPSVFTALQEQLGLKLVSQKAPIEILTIVRVDRPSEN